MMVAGVRRCQRAFRPLAIARRGGRPRSAALLMLLDRGHDGRYRWTWRPRAARASTTRIPSLADDCEQTGFERHSVALLLLGLLTFVMGSGAAFGRSRPAAVALIAIGVVVLGLALLAGPAGERRHRRDRPATTPAAEATAGHRAVARAGGRGAGGCGGALTFAAAERLALRATLAVFLEALLALRFPLRAARVGLLGRLVHAARTGTRGSEIGEKRRRRRRSRRSGRPPCRQRGRAPQTAPRTCGSRTRRSARSESYDACLGRMAA